MSPKTILIVGSDSKNPQSQASLQRIHNQVEAGFEPGEAICYATYLDDILYTIGTDILEAHDTRNNLSLAAVDCVFIRGFGMRDHGGEAAYLSMFCELKQLACINRYSMYYTGTKLAQTFIFRELKLPFLQTMYIADNQTLTTRAAEAFGYPYILKANDGSHGESNYLIHDSNEAQRALAAEPTTDFLTQAFCPNDRDYRLLLMSDSHLLFERRGPAGSHLNNTSQGGQATPALDALPETIITQARTLSARLGLQMSGVDVMPHLETGEYYFLEINTQPELWSGALLKEKSQELRTLLLSSSSKNASKT